LARSLADQALLLAQGLDRPADALAPAEEAHRLATKHGLAILAKDTQRILDFVRSKLT
jgi:hypothetical protein